MKRRVDFGGDTTVNGHAVKLEDISGILICHVDYGGAVRADLEVPHVASFDERIAELGDVSVAEGYAVKLSHTIGILVGDVDHGVSIRADLGKKYITTVNEGTVELLPVFVWNR
jgi:hypothetical protein